MYIMARMEGPLLEIPVISFGLSRVDGGHMKIRLWFWETWL